jgi:type II secretory pathway component PulK
MWLLVLMMAILAVGAQHSRLDTRTSLSSVEKIRCRWLARAGEETAMAYLMDDLRDVDSSLDEWALSTEDFENVQLTDGTYTVTITDESSKLNLNTATANQLLNLDTASMNETIADSILDWRDTDEDIRTNGAETGYYLNLNVGYSCRNSSFRTPREVLRVRGMTEDLFYGKNNRILGQGGWSRFMTCYSAVKNADASGNARVNVNSAQESDLISKLSLSASQARYITQNRPFTNIAGLVGIKISTTSSTGSSGTNSGSNGSTGSSGGSGSGRNSNGSSSAVQYLNFSPVAGTLVIHVPQFSTVAALLAAGEDNDDDGPGPGGPGPGGPPGGEGGGPGGPPGGEGGGPGGPPGGEGGGPGGPPGGEGGGPGMERGPGGGGEGGPGGRGGRGRGGRGGRGGGRGGRGGRGGGQSTAMQQTQPLDWATLGRIFDQITLTDNTMITGQININTVGIEVLRAFLEGNDELANKMISYRDSQGGEITNVCNLMNIDGMTQQTLAKYLDQLSVRSSVYLIRATAQSKSCGVHYFIERVINRDREGREVLYKLEGIGN